MERPILVSGPLISPIQKGIKTDTRRTRGLDIINETPDSFDFIGFSEGAAVFRHNTGTILPDYHIPCPYGQAGDLLWVRENFYFWFGWDSVKPKLIPKDNNVKFWYVADGQKHELAGKMRPSIFMPRWLSRITLELTGVTVERLHNITEEGANREGVQRGFVRVDTSGQKNKYSFEPNPQGTYLRGFYFTWCQLNGKESWYSNPWVWVLTFKIKKP